jgi:hypothetical protein
MAVDGDDDRLFSAIVELDKLLHANKSLQHEEPSSLYFVLVGSQSSGKSGVLLQGST